MSTLTIQNPAGDIRRVEAEPHAGGAFFTWHDVDRQIDLYPSAWRTLGYEVVEVD